MSLIPSAILDYCISHSTTPSNLARELQTFTQENIHGSHMLIGEMEASVLIFLMKLAGVETVLELGTFTGYSALIMAEQLPQDGKLITIDQNPQTSKIAQEFWDKSPHGQKISLKLKTGLEALKEIDQKFDLIFIDADKGNYSNYLAWSLDHLSEKGFIVVDNTLWSGKVIEPNPDKQTSSILDHNTKAKSLSGYVKTLLPIRDGMYLIQKG